jgi:uncharacterized iron-regulated protein
MVASCLWLRGLILIYKNLFTVCLLFLLTGCLTPNKTTFWLDIYEGEIVPFENVVSDLKESQIIYVGETHRLKRHHDWQVKILQSLTRDGKPMALGLEMVETFNQPALDRFNRKEIDFDALAKEINWAGHWSNYKSYQPLLEVAQKNNVKVLALDLRAALVREVGRRGLKALSKEQKKELPKIINWQKDPVYRQYLDRLMKVHMSVNDARLEMIFQAQVLRDETMAQVIVSYLSRPGNKNHQVMVVTGSGHVNYGLGLPQRVRRSLPYKRDRIVMFTVGDDLQLTASEKKQSRPITITHEHLKAIPNPIADYLHVSQK